MNRKYTLGFSTLGTPKDGLDGIVRRVARHHLDFIELRAIDGSLDLPGYFEKHPVSEFMPPARVIGSSLTVLTAREADLESFFRWAFLAHRLGVPYIRVFGGMPFEQNPSREHLTHAAQVVQRVREYFKDREWNVELLLEVHDAFSSSPRCLELSEYMNTNAPLSLLWDSHHTWKVAGESPSETWEQLGKYIRHIHYRDSVSKVGFKGEYECVISGVGEFPTSQLKKVLLEKGYSGGVSLEWENYWHPELPDPEDAMCEFVRIFSSADE